MLVRDHYVYLLISKDLKLLKIGTSRNVANRVAAVNADSGHGFRLLYAVHLPRKTAFFVELEIKRLLEDRRAAVSVYHTETFLFSAWALELITGVIRGADPDYRAHKTREAPR